MRLRKAGPKDTILHQELNQFEPLPVFFQPDSTNRLIIEVLDQAIGEIRYTLDQKAIRFWIRLLPNMRNMGFGKQAMLLWFNQEKFEQTEQMVIATLEEENEALSEFLLSLGFRYGEEKLEYTYHKDIFGTITCPLDRAFLTNVTPRQWETKVQQENPTDLQVPGVLLLKTIANVDVLSGMYEPSDVITGILINIMKDHQVYPLTLSESMLQFASSYMSQDERAMLLWKSQRLKTIPGYDLILNVLEENVTLTYQTPDVLTMIRELSNFIQNVTEDHVFYLTQIKLKDAMRRDNPSDFDETIRRFHIHEKYFLEYYDSCLKTNKTKMLSWFQAYEEKYHNDPQQSDHLAKLRIQLTKETRADDVKILPFLLDLESSLFQEIALKVGVVSKEFISNRFSPLTPQIEDNLIWLLQEGKLNPNASKNERSVMHWMIILGSPKLLEVALPLWKGKKPEAGIDEIFIHTAFQENIESLDYLLPSLKKATLVQWSTLFRSALSQNMIENAMYFVKYVPLTSDWVKRENQDRLLISARDHQYHAFVYLVRFFFGPNVMIDGIPLLVAVIAKKNLRAFQWLVSQEDTKLHPISFQYTALRAAAYVDFIEAVVYLKEHGVPLDLKGKENHAVFGVSKKKSPLSYRYLHSFDPKFGRLKDVLEIIGYVLILLAGGVALYFWAKWKGYF